MESRNPESPSRPFPGFVLPLFLGAVLLWPGSHEVSAQTPGSGGDEGISATEELMERPTEISPRSGPPGTKVTVRGHQLPAVTPINLAFGGTRAGFEGLAFVLTDRYGDVEETLEVPEWAEPDQIHRFIIFDAYFDPISITGLFHVTDEDGHLHREGEIVSIDGECAEFVGADEDFYYLLGDLDGHSEGDEISLEGPFVETTQCGDGAHIEVASVRGSR